MEWVLLVFISAPGGYFIDKTVEPVRTYQECIDKSKATPRKTYKGIQDTVCVTIDHWTGKAPMPGMAMD
jgi:hypothetical protein